MKDLKLTDDGDLDMSSLDLDFVDGEDCVAQAIYIRIHFFLGEYENDTSLGVPWFQRILVKGTPSHIIDGILREVLLSTPGIIEIVSFTKTLNAENRSLAIDASVRRTGGEILDFNDVFVLPSTINI